MFLAVSRDRPAPLPSPAAAPRPAVTPRGDTAHPANTRPSPGAQLSTRAAPPSLPSGYAGRHRRGAPARPSSPRPPPGSGPGGEAARSRRPSGAAPPAALRPPRQPQLPARGRSPSSGDTAAAGGPHPAWPRAARAPRPDTVRASRRPAGSFPPPPAPPHLPPSLPPYRRRWGRVSRCRARAGQAGVALRLQRLPPSCPL